MHISRGIKSVVRIFSLALKKARTSTKEQGFMRKRIPIYTGFHRYKEALEWVEKP